MPQVPGDEGYNDFRLVNEVSVPDDYTPNSVTSEQGINDAGYEVTETSRIVNVPMVPEGSNAPKRFRGGNPHLFDAWYDGQLAGYFKLAEAPLQAVQGRVPTSPIYVMFNKNPPEGGPRSGFMTEEGSKQNHNVVATTPGDPEYSPLWIVNVNNNQAFSEVSDLQSAKEAETLAEGAASVNCPIVNMGEL